MRWCPWITVLAGVGLVVAPFATGYYAVSNVATVEAIALGVVIAGLGLWTAFGETVPAWVDYLLMLCGGWSIVAPWVLAYSTTTTMARNTDVIAGIIVAGAAVYRLVTSSPGARQKVAA